MWIAIGLFYQMISNHLTILYAWVSRSHICEIDQNPGLTGIGICFVCYQQHWESWKGFEITIDGLMTINERICIVVWWYPDISHRHFMLHWAINYIIERFGYFLVFHSINYHGINYRTHQKVTKTLNKVINSSMKHKMSMAYVRIYTQQSIFFHKVSSDHHNDNFEAFSRLSILLDSSQNKYQFLSSLHGFWSILQMWLLLTQAYNIVKFFGIIILIEEIHSYPHLWKFPENILKYIYIYMGGLLKSVNCLLRRTVVLKAGHLFRTPFLSDSKNDTELVYGLSGLGWRYRGKVRLPGLGMGLGLGLASAFRSGVIVAGRNFIKTSPERTWHLGNQGSSLINCMPS